MILTVYDAGSTPGITDWLDHTTVIESPVLIIRLDGLVLTVNPSSNVATEKK